MGRAGLSPGGGAPSDTLPPLPSCLGKSTVAALLERFYEPTEGAIFLDGRNICTLNPTWLRGEIIGFINQVRRGGAGR